MEQNQSLNGDVSRVTGFSKGSSIENSEKIIRFLARTGDLIGSSLDESENLQNLGRLLVPRLTDEVAIWAFSPGGEMTPTLFPRISSRRDSSWRDPALATQVVRTGLSVREEHFCCLPLRVRHTVIGAIECRNHPPRAFDEDDLILLEEVAHRAAIAFDNARLFQTLKKTESELREAKRQAEAASQTKSQFLANMSHEIRTPLGAILGFVDLMLTPGERAEDVITWGQKIKKNGSHLIRLIDEILDLSKIESGHLEISPHSFSFEDFLEEVHSSLIGQALQKGIDLEFVISTPLPRSITSDSTRLKQILFNLIGNAIKFTDEGSVQVHLSFNSQKNRLVFRVKDTGIGLSQEQSQRLFRPFSQGDASHTRRFGGTGLGLVLSRDLARMLGGDVSLVASTPSVGSVFEASVCGGLCAQQSERFDELRKLGSSQLRKETQRPENILKGIKVLVVEDSLDNQFLISRFLKSAGAEVDVAEDGARGLEKAMRGSDDLILMDIQMPFLNGHQVTEILRKSGDRRPILALTAHALKEEVEKSLIAGCNDHLTKPIDRNKLIDMVADFVEKTRQNRSQDNALS